MSRVIAWLLVAALALAAAGCSPSVKESVESAEQMEPVSPQPPAVTAPADFGYLNGDWLVTVALTDLDQESMRDALAGDEQSWTLALDDMQLQLDTGKSAYSGELEPELDDGWVYRAATTQTDEDGAQWKSVIEVHGRGTAEDEFVGRMTLIMESPPGVHQYEATWDIAAKRR